MDSLVSKFTSRVSKLREKLPRLQVTQGNSQSCSTLDRMTNHQVPVHSGAQIVETPRSAEEFSIHSAPAVLIGQNLDASRSVHVDTPPQDEVVLNVDRFMQPPCGERAETQSPTECRTVSEKVGVDLEVSDCHRRLDLGESQSSHFGQSNMNGVAPQRSISVEHVREHQSSVASEPAEHTRASRPDMGSITNTQIHSVSCGFPQTDSRYSLNQDQGFEIPDEIYKRGCELGSGPPQTQGRIASCNFEISRGSVQVSHGENLLESGQSGHIVDFGNQSSMVAPNMEANHANVLEGPNPGTRGQMCQLASFEPVNSGPPQAQGRKTHAYQTRFDESIRSRDEPRVHMSSYGDGYSNSYARTALADVPETHNMADRIYTAHIEQDRSNCTGSGLALQPEANPWPSQLPVETSESRRSRGDCRFVAAGKEATAFQDGKF